MAKKSISRVSHTSRSGPPDSKVGRPDKDRRVRQSARIARVLRVLTLIQSRGCWNVQAIAQELECSERTVYRDLEVLEFAGVPWYFDDQQQCYRVRPDYRFPALNLSDDEVLGQAVATVVSKAVGLDVSSGATPTTRKLAVTSRENVQHLIDDATQLIEVLDLKLVDHSRHQEMIRTIQRALLERKQLSGTYESPYEDSPVKLKLHPYRLCLIKNAWYLVGQNTQDNDVRTLRVVRFKSLRAIDSAALIPSDFDLRSYFGNAWAVFRGNTTFEIEVRFISAAAKVVTETAWHPTQRITRHKDGSVSLHFRVDGLDEIENWILSWTGRVAVVAPVELRDRIQKRLRTALELHDSFTA